MLHPSDTDRLDQLEKDYRVLKQKYDKLLSYLGLLDEEGNEHQTIPAPPPGSDPPKYCACSSPGCSICHP